MTYCITTNPVHAHNLWRSMTERRINQFSRTMLAKAITKQRRNEGLHDIACLRWWIFAFAVTIFVFFVTTWGWCDLLTAWSLNIICTRVIILSVVRNPIKAMLFHVTKTTYTWLLLFGSCFTILPTILHKNTNRPYVHVNTRPNLFELNKCY